MENALDACREIPNGKRYIYLDISYAKEVLQLIIRNNYQIKRKKDRHGNYLTTKADRLHHGLGLASIRQAVEHYHGQMEITDKDNEFQVVVILYGADSNEQPTT